MRLILKPDTRFSADNHHPGPITCNSWTKYTVAQYLSLYLCLCFPLSLSHSLTLPPSLLSIYLYVNLCRLHFPWTLSSSCNRHWKCLNLTVTDPIFVTLCCFFRILRTFKSMLLYNKHVCPVSHGNSTEFFRYHYRTFPLAAEFGTRKQSDFTSLITPCCSIFKTRAFHS